MKSIVLSIFLGIALAACLGLLVKLGMTNAQLEQSNAELAERYSDADLKLGRAQTRLGTIELENTKLREDIKREIDERRAVVIMYGRLEAEYISLKEEKVKPEIVYYEGETIKLDEDCPKFVRGLLYEAITEKVLSPIAEFAGEVANHEIMIRCSYKPRAGRDRAQPLTVMYKLQLTLAGEVVEVRLPDGGINHYAQIWAVDREGKKVKDLEFKELTFVVRDEAAPRFWWWAPHIDVGLLAGLHTDATYSMGGSAGVSIMGWGKTKNDLSWRFPRLSFDYVEKPAIGVTPVLYNLGENLPVISDLWVGPHVTWGFQDDAFIGVVIGSVL